MTRRKKLSLKVIFDTNVIYTGSANDLLRKEIVELINEHKILSDIEIEWCIPETVIQERIFQMNKKANELLPSILKLEKLLGHNLNITKEIVEDRVQNTVFKQLEQFKINIIKIDTKKVDWESIILKSLSRLPPFEDNEKEKGFRDALILESVKDLILSSPVTKTVCRVIFITNDGPLGKAASSIDKLPNNVHIFSNIDELISLINILDSEITEERINKIIDLSEKLFFEKDNELTLWYSQDIRSQITNKFPNELSINAEGGNTREGGTWWIPKPGFEKKTKQQVTWKTIITVDFTTYNTTILHNTTGSFPTANQLYSTGMGLTIGNAGSNTILQTGLGNYDPRQFSTRKEKIGEGKTRFEVTWSVTLTTDNKLKNPKIENYKYLETVFN